jgi:heterodisulfide reductase subunit B
MNYAYYPGCSLLSTAQGYDHSFRQVCARLGIELSEVPGWICCGSTPAHSTSRLLALALPIKNLQLAQKTGAEKMIVPCAACFSRFKFAISEIEKDQKIKREIEQILEAPIPESPRVIHPLELFSQEHMLKKINTQIKKHPPQLKLVCYYGCLLTRPPKVTQFDHCENPITMDNILTAAGFNPQPWSYKTDCCGASLTLTETEVSLKLIQKLIDQAKLNGAEAIALACTLCQTNLDTRQKDISRTFGDNYQMPVLFFTQLLGLAFGIAPKQLLLNKHLTCTKSVVKKFNI